MKVSCIIPAFERYDLFARCLASAASQERVDIEIVVTDNSMTRTARDRIGRLTTAVAGARYVAGARSGNPVDNWNAGLAAAGAPVRVLLHQDEVLLDPCYLRRAADRLADPGVAAAIGGVRVVGIDRPSRFALARTLARGVGRPTWLLPSLNWIGPTAAFVFRRGHSFDRDLVQLVDVDFYRRVLATGRAAFLSGRQIGSLGHHAGQITAAIEPAALTRAELPRLASGIELAFHRSVCRLRIVTG